MTELGPLGLQPLDRGIGGFPTFPSFPKLTLENLSEILSRPVNQWPSSSLGDAPAPDANNTGEADAGFGSLSGSQAASSFFSGATQGLSGWGMGKAADAVGLDPNGLAAKIANIAAKTAAKAMGLPGLPMMAIDAIGGGIRNLSEDARNSTIGPRQGLPSLADIIRGMYDGPPAGGLPNGFNTDFGLAPTPVVANMDLTGYATPISDPTNNDLDMGLGNLPAGFIGSLPDPSDIGQDGGGTGTSGIGDGPGSDSGGVGGVW